MMYKSPIEIIYSSIEVQMENEIYKEVLKCRINVDKEELIKALKYDRNQYEKGYQDCTEEHVKVLEKALDIAIDKYTCGYPNMRDKVKNEITNQLFIAVEECAELIQAISKCLRSKEAIPIKGRMNLIEEMADIMICLEQLQIMYYIDDEELYAIKQKEENRLITREGLKE